MGRVLLVDDDAELRSLLREVLEAEGYQVSEAAEGDAALALLRGSPYRFVVLLDYLMPRGGGKQMMHQVSQDAVLSTQHVYVLVTARRRLSLPVELVNTLALPVLRKPFDLDDVLVTVAEAERRLEARRLVGSP